MPPGGYRDYVESVRAAVDITQVVGEAVALRKAGRSLIGLCPFHQEKSPSFHVDPAKGLYFCFGCGAGGDAFKFVMNFHQVEFPEAVAMLGDRAGIPRPAPSTAHEAGEARRRRRMLEALDHAQSFFVACLTTPEGAAAREQLARRCLAMEDARRFGIGFAPPGWDGVLRHLAARSFQVEELVHAGLVVPRPSGDGAYDRFRNRLTFPIRDTAGRIVSFGGRALSDSDTPKYLNGPETVVYDKGRTFFRLHEEAGGIRQSRTVVVVEGYFDALSLAAAGVTGVIAVCGAALSSAHAQLLRRYAEKVVLFFDGDSAGRRAAHRALPALLAAGLTVRVAFPPEGKDPDDLAREGRKDAVEGRLAAAEDLPQFLASEAKANYDLVSLEGRVKALEMVLGHIVHVDSPLVRAEAVTRVSESLGIEDRLVREELRRAARDRLREVGPRATGGWARQRARRFSEAEAQLLRFLVDSPEDRLAETDEILAETPREALSPVGRALVERWLEARREGKALTLRQLAEVAPPDAAADILALAFAPGLPPDPAAVRGALDALEAERLRSRLASLQQEIEHTRDPSTLEHLIEQKVRVAREIQTLAGRGAEAPPRRAPMGGLP